MNTLIKIEDFILNIFGANRQLAISFFSRKAMYVYILLAVLFTSISVFGIEVPFYNDLLSSQLKSYIVEFFVYSAGFIFLSMGLSELCYELVYRFSISKGDSRKTIFKIGEARHFDSAVRTRMFLIFLIPSIHFLCVYFQLYSLNMNKIDIIGQPAYNIESTFYNYAMKALYVLFRGYIGLFSLTCVFGLVLKLIPNSNTFFSKIQSLNPFGLKKIGKR